MSHVATKPLVPLVPGRQTVPAAPLRLVPECHVLVGDGVLHVITRRGSFDLKGKDVPRLHEKLRPFLQGTHSEAELLAAVPPPLATAVRTYLGRLQEMGALREGSAEVPDPSLNDALNALGPAHPTLSFRAGGLRVYVSLDGAPVSPPDGLCLCFVRPEEAAPLLLGLPDRARNPGRLTCVVAESPSGRATEAELERRAAYARWLIRLEVEVLPDVPRVQLFRLGAHSGELERMAVAEPSDLATIPEQLGIVRAVDLDQLPLVVAQASHPFFPQAVAGYGLTFSGVRDHLLRAFLSRALLRPDEDGGCDFLHGVTGTPLKTYRPARLACEKVEQGAVASSLAALQLGLLEELADARRAASEADWEEVDLLADEPDEHPAVAYLRSVLRLRVPRLCARLETTRDGLFIYETGQNRARSFLRAKALAEVLLAATWAEFYGTPGGGSAGMPFLRVCEHAEFAPGVRIRRLVRGRAAALAWNGEPVRMTVRRLHSCGTSLWVGVLGGTADSGRAK